MDFLWISHGFRSSSPVLLPPPGTSAPARGSRSAAADGLVKRQLRVGIGQLNGGSTTAAEVVAEVVKDLGMMGVILYIYIHNRCVI